MTPTPPREASFEEDLTLAHDDACQCSAIVVCRKCKETREIIRAAHARELAAVRAETWRTAANMLRHRLTHYADHREAVAVEMEQRAAATEKEGR